MADVLMLVCGCAVLLLSVFVVTAIGDKHDAAETTISTTPEWLENYRLNICCSMSKTGAVTEVNKTFQEIQKLLDIWDDLYGENPNLISERKEVRSLFEITIKNIEHFCSEFKKERITKKELVKELDGQIARLNDLLRSLASISKLRGASFV